MKNNLNLIILLSIISILFFIVGIYEKLNFDYFLYVGIISLTVSYILFFKYQKYFKYYVGLILIFGTFNLIQFVPFQFGFAHLRQILCHNSSLENQ